MTRLAKDPFSSPFKGDNYYFGIKESPKGMTKIHGVETLANLPSSKNLFIEKGTAIKQDLVDLLKMKKVNIYWIVKGY